MVQQSFELKQIEKRVDELFDYLDNRKLRLNSKNSDLNDMNVLYDRVEALSHKIGKLRGLFSHSVVDVLDKQRNDLIVNAMMTLPEDESMKLIKKLRNQSDGMHQDVSDNSDKENQQNDVSYSSDPFAKNNQKQS